MRDRSVAFLVCAVGVDEDGAGETLGLHLLQIVGDGLAGDIAIEPPPVGPQAGVEGRVVPAIVQRVTGGHGGPRQSGHHERGSQNEKLSHVAARPHDCCQNAYDVRIKASQKAGRLAA